ncbi:MAG: hypothetical protein K8F91_02060, partial [Candidatus Obscuribacterales bacterium]|nr:hypothetical protein [Candidatus Obscuribacterales bacterium]
LREIIIQNASPGKAAALAQLKYLESLRFKDCAIGESDFLVLAKLPRLKELFFQACTVDGAFVDGLKKLNIKRLVLNRMKISESQIKQLALLKGLSTLELRGLDVSEKLIRYLNNSLPKTSVQAVPGGDNTW